MTWTYDEATGRWNPNDTTDPPAPGSKPTAGTPPLAAARLALTDAGATEADAVWRAMLRLIWAEFAAGRTVAWPNVGRFAPRWRPARTGRNPRTGGPVAIPACWRLTYREAASLRDAIN